MKGWHAKKYANKVGMIMGIASNEAEEARASSLFCVRTHARIGNVL